MTHFFDLEVYYEDTDFSGAVYHPNYLKFLERARSAAVASVGIDQIGLKSTGGAFVVRSLSAEFLLPTYFNDKLRVVTSFKQIGGASIQLEQKIFKQKNCVFSATVKLGLVVNGRPVRLPDGIRHKLMQLD